VRRRFVVIALLVGIHALVTSAAEGQTARLMKIGALTES
jgi:hypothetical protein